MHLNKKIILVSLLLAGAVNFSQAQNVGINTNNPTETLHVDGTVRITSLSGVGNRMLITDANGVLSTQAIPAGGGTLTGVTAGDGLTGGGTTGNPTLDVVAVNGLNTNANDIRLGGALMQATTISQGAHEMIFNLDGIGDFTIRDAGVRKFAVLDDGTSRFGGEVQWRTPSTNGGVIADLFVSGTSGHFRLFDDGNTGVDLDASAGYIFNQQGNDRDLRIESTTNSTMLFVDAGNNRVGVGIGFPTETIHIEGGARVTDLSGVGSRMVVASATGVLSTQAIPAGGGTDDQNLTSATLTGNNLAIAIENGNPVSVDLTSLVNDADAVIGNEYNTGFSLVGNNLRLTDGGGTRTVDLSSLGGGASTVDNGLNISGSDIHLGGTLIENTTITQGAFGMTYNLTTTGEFNIQDNGTNKFTVLNNGNSAFGGDVDWRDNNSVTGTILASLEDDGDDGRFTVRENGAISIDLDANTQTVFNEQGLDRNFRVESDANANMLFVNAGNNRVGIGTGAPSEALHVQEGARINTGLRIGATGYGTHLLMAASTATPAIMLGNTSFNNAESGRLTFEENTPTYTTAGPNYCGFQIYHDGFDDQLIFSSNCGAGLEILTLERNGDVGITTNAPTANLSVNGIANKTGGGTWAVFSDKRLKKDVSNFTEGLDFITKVRTVNFKYNDKMEEIWGEDLRNKNRVYQGVIAQELQEIAPDMVREVQMADEKNPEDADYDPNSVVESESFLEVDPNKFTYALINAVKEQQAMIEQLKKEQANTQKELAELKEVLKK